jgi:hypothetical protein
LKIFKSLESFPFHDNLASISGEHKEKPPGQKERGKRTIAKEQLYKVILAEIHKIRPRFNVGISTGSDGDLTNSWHAPY